MWIRCFLIAFLIVLGGCQPTVFKRETSVFGTFVTITIAEESPRNEKAIATVFSAFRQMHRRFHPWEEGELYQVNKAIADANFPITLSEDMVIMLSLSIDFSQKSMGLFNPSIGALVDLWGFHRQKVKSPPTDESLSSWFGNIPSMQNFVVKGNFLQSAPSRAQLDFGAIAKGVALDNARTILENNGVKNALINVGGNILAMGNNNGLPWRVGLATAESWEKPIAVINLRDGEAVATSGDSERFFVYQGKKYHHILDPRTGYPAVDPSLAIVVVGDIKHAGAMSDAAATALVIANADERESLINRFDLKMVWQHGKEGGLTAKMKERLQQSSLF